jgi:heme-degrading monooxygenase HmoA
MRTYLYHRLVSMTPATVTAPAMKAFIEIARKTAKNGKIRAAYRIFIRVCNSKECVMSIAATPAAPYYAVIFTSIRIGQDPGYDKMSEAMAESAAKQPGFLGVESAREEVGITVSYWASLEAIAAWKAEASHLIAQQLGRDAWYAAYKTRICRVERDYDFGAS